MAIVVLVLWLFTGGVGVYLLVTSNLGRARPAAKAQAAEPPAASVAAAVQAASAAQAAPQAAPAQAAAPPASKREIRRAARNRFDPPSLTAAKKAPVVPELRSLLEFAHPASGIIGFGFWLGYTFVHYRALGWIALGLVTVTVCLGLTWFTANTRAARHRPADEPGPSFSTRLVVLHGGAATVTFVLAVLSALVLGR
jgi:hypothetical protein